MHRVSVQTTQKREIIDITDKISSLLGASAALNHIFVMHTTAAITTMDLDPGTDLDFLEALDGLLPDINWRHPHDPAHTPDHLLASLIGPDVSVPSEDGQLLLGTWQRIVLVEFDGPRERTITVSQL